MALDTSSAATPGSPSTFQAMFSGAVCTSDPSQGNSGVGVHASAGSVSGGGGWSMADSPNVVALVRLTVTQSPSCARITSGWIGSLPSPLDTCWDASSARTAGIAELSTYMNPLGSCTPKRFSGMLMLMAEMSKVSCGAVAHGLLG